MSKQRFTPFTTIGFIGFFLILALTSLQEAGNPANDRSTGHQPQPVAAPIAISAPAKTTPAPAFDITQPTIQPAPQPAPTPASAAKESVAPATPSLLPILLLGLLMGGTVVLILGFAVCRSLYRRRNVYQNILPKGVHA